MVDLGWFPSDWLRAQRRAAPSCWRTCFTSGIELDIFLRGERQERAHVPFHPRSTATPRQTTVHTASCQQTVGLTHAQPGSNPAPAPFPAYLLAVFSPELRRPSCLRNSSPVFICRLEELPLCSDEDTYIYTHIPKQTCLNSGASQRGPRRPSGPRPPPHSSRSPITRQPHLSPRPRRGSATPEGALRKS